MESPNLDDLLAQAQAKLGQATEAEEQKKQESIAESLENREVSLESAKTFASEAEKAEEEIHIARGKLESARGEIDRINEKADMLRSAGMEAELQNLLEAKNAEIVTAEASLAESEARAASAHENLSETEQEIENIVPGRMEDTVTPEQMAARTALEEEAYGEDQQRTRENTLSTSEEFYDEAKQIDKKIEKDKKDLEYRKYQEEEDARAREILNQKGKKYVDAIREGAKQVSFDTSQPFIEVSLKDKTDIFLRLLESARDPLGGTEVRYDVADLAKNVISPLYERFGMFQGLKEGDRLSLDDLSAVL